MTEQNNNGEVAVLLAGLAIAVAVLIAALQIKESRALICGAVSIFCDDRRSTDPKLFQADLIDKTAAPPENPLEPPLPGMTDYDYQENLEEPPGLLLSALAGDLSDSSKSGDCLRDPANLPRNGESRLLKTVTYLGTSTWKIDKIGGFTQQRNDRLFLFQVLMTYPILTRDVSLSIVVRHRLDMLVRKDTEYIVTLPKNSRQAVFACILPDVGRGANDFDFEMTDDFMHTDRPLEASLSVQ